MYSFNINIWQGKRPESSQRLSEEQKIDTTSFYLRQPGVIGRCNFLPHKYKYLVSLGLNLTSSFFFHLTNLKDGAIESDVDGAIMSHQLCNTFPGLFAWGIDQCAVIGKPRPSQIKGYFLGLV